MVDLDVAVQSEKKGKEPLNNFKKSSVPGVHPVQQAVASGTARRGRAVHQKNSEVAVTETNSGRRALMSIP